MKASRLLGSAVAVGVTALAAGCGTPGDSASDTPKTTTQAQAKPDIAKAGNVTLTVWDQEVRGGQAAQIQELNKEFQAKYPNITLKRVTRSFDDLKTTLKLALSGNQPPDVFQANNGRPDMGSFVQAGQLVPLDRYAEAYKWTDRYPEAVRKYSSYSTDGKTFGTGSLYGLPQV